MKKSLFLSITLVLLSTCTLFAHMSNPNQDLDFSVGIKPGKTPIPSIKPKTIVNNDIDDFKSDFEKAKELFCGKYIIIQVESEKI